MRSLFAAVCVIASGCMFQGQSTMERLQESVHGINEEARWGRVDLAQERVDTPYRARFTEARRSWQKRVQIADVELVHVELLPGKDHAISDVGINWYELSTMELRTTTIHQKWRRDGNKFYLTGEHVVEGDASLLEAPRKPVKTDAPSGAKADANAKAVTSVESSQFAP